VSVHGSVGGLKPTPIPIAIAPTVTLLDGATAIGTGPVTNGTWSIAANTPLTEGANSITAMETYGVGNVSAASAATMVTLDTTDPVVVGVTAVPPARSSALARRQP
jgi:hypothetical protein